MCPEREQCDGPAGGQLVGNATVRSGGIDCTAVRSQTDPPAVTGSDPAGPGLLVQLHGRARAAGATLTVHEPDRLVRRVLEVTGLIDVIPVR